MNIHLLRVNSTYSNLESCLLLTDSFISVYYYLSVYHKSCTLFGYFSTFIYQFVFKIKTKKEFISF